MAAAPFRLARRGDRQSMLLRTRVDQLDEQVRQRKRLVPDPTHVGLAKNRQSTFDQRQGHDRLRAAQRAPDAVAGGKTRRHRKRCGMRPPARQRLREGVLMTLRHPDECRCARPAIEILVGAADGKIGLCGMQIDFERAGRMRKVPDRQCALCMRMGRERGHIVQVAATIVHVGQHDDRGLGIDCSRQFFGRINQPQAVAAIQPGGQAFGDVQVGWKIGALADNRAARCRCLHLQCGGQYLEQVDRGRIRDCDLTGDRADQRRQHVTEPQRHLKPAGLIPAANKIGSPFVRHHLQHPLQRHTRTGAERIAIEINHPIRQIETRAQAGQRIGGV